MERIADKDVNQIILDLAAPDINLNSALENLQVFHDLGDVDKFLKEKRFSEVKGIKNLRRLLKRWSFRQFAGRGGFANVVKDNEGILIPIIYTHEKARPNTKVHEAKHIADMLSGFQSNNPYKYENVCSGYERMILTSAIAFSSFAGATCIIFSHYPDEIKGVVAGSLVFASLVSFALFNAQLDKFKEYSNADLEIRAREAENTYKSL